MTERTLIRSCAYGLLLALCLIRDHSNTQELILMILIGPYIVLGIKSSQLHKKQVSSPCTIYSAPQIIFSFTVMISLFEKYKQQFKFVFYFGFLILKHQPQEPLRLYSKKALVGLKGRVFYYLINLSYYLTIGSLCEISFQKRF